MACLLPQAGAQEGCDNALCACGGSRRQWWSSSDGATLAADRRICMLLHAPSQWRVEKLARQGVELCGPPLSRSLWEREALEGGQGGGFCRAAS